MQVIAYDNSNNENDGKIRPYCFSILAMYNAEITINAEREKINVQSSLKTYLYLSLSLSEDINSS